MEYLVIEDFLEPTKQHNGWFIIIKPFRYNDNRQPRLPRKNSKSYALRTDVKFYFNHIFSKINEIASLGKFSVSISVINGNDRLGGADLDNYCKAILDGITSTKKIWVDDKQVDELTIKRKYDSSQNSMIEVYVVPM